MPLKDIADVSGEVHTKGWNTWQFFNTSLESRSGEAYSGHYGAYETNQGFKQDFYPYDQTLEEYREQIRSMNLNGFIKIGRTKMVDVDFTMAIPASAYYVAVNMLFEFNPYGQVIPTRIDILPYKLSPFAEYKED